MLTAFISRASRGLPLLLAAVALGVVLFLVASFVLPRHTQTALMSLSVNGDSVGAPAVPAATAAAQPSTASAEPANAASAAAAPSPAAAPGSGSIGKHAVEAASSPRRKFETAKNYAALYAELSSRGDADSLYFARRALNECLPFITGGEGFKVDQTVALRPNDASTPLRIAAFNEQKSRCEGFNLGSSQELWATRRALRDQLVAAGDPRIQAEQLRWAIMRGTPVDTAMRSLGQLAQGGDPYVLDQAGSTVAAIKDKSEFLVGPDREPASSEVVGAAFRLAACDAGADCGAARLWQACAINAECGAQTRSDYVQRYRFSPAQFELVQRVRQAIEQGIAAGDMGERIIASKPAA